MGGSNATGIRAWAFCAPDGTGDVTVVASNFNNRDVWVNLTLNGGAPPVGWRQQYVLTAPGGNLESQTVLLNGVALALQADGSLPDMPPITAPAATPMQWPPLSYGFIRLLGASARGCWAGEGLVE
jgi:hypothetical protein